MNTIPAQEIKRGGITAVDKHLDYGAVHVITHNRPTYVVMTEEQYAALVEEAHAGVLARVRESLADFDAGRSARYMDVGNLLAAIHAADDDDDLP